MDMALIIVLLIIVAGGTIMVWKEGAAADQALLKQKAQPQVAVHAAADPSTQCDGRD